MRIRNIDMVGFKSFTDKTRIVFHDGISVVVGPNGCGKSNIVDAIRWVMGEQSAKSLRGGEMMDVLFAGAEGRKPTGMAQVSLLFSCDDGVYPAGYETVSEIEITRRLYRSGESEYQINRVACRLKDIQEMLMDTGVGSRTYSIIEQGQIAKVLSAKPQERRFLIEEAAGTTKFRHRREETERKIESTRQNLEQISILLTEIRHHVGSLARQAGKARRYKEFSDEVRTIDLELTAREAHELSLREAESERLTASLKERIVSSQAQVAADEAQIEARRLDYLREAKALETRRVEMAGRNEELHRAESARSDLQREAAEETARIEAYQSESTKAMDAAPGHESESEAALDEARAVAAEMAGKQTELDDLVRQQVRHAADGLAQALKAARRDHLLLLLAGFAVERGFAEEAHDFFAHGDASRARTLRLAPDSLITRLAPGLARPVGLIAPKSALAAAAEGADLARLIRKMRGADLTTRARRVL